VLSMTLFGFLLAQAPATAARPASAAQPPSTFSERELGKAFRLKSEHFLTWRGAFRPMQGRAAELVEVWRVEISPTAPKFSKLALSVELTSSEHGAGSIHPRLEYVVHKNLRLGLLGLRF